MIKIKAKESKKEYDGFPVKVKITEGMFGHSLTEILGVLKTLLRIIEEDYDITDEVLIQLLKEDDIND